MWKLRTLPLRWTGRRPGAFAEASPGEQQKLRLLLSLRLQELTATEGRTLQTVMDKIGRTAEARGLTLETLLLGE